MGIQSGIPLFYLQELANVGAKLKFEDRFVGTSLASEWNEFLGHTAAGKSVVVADGVVKIRANAGTNATWKSSYNESPRIWIDLPSFPCEITTKLVSYAEGGCDCCAGIFIARHICDPSPNVDYFMIGRHCNEQGHHGLSGVHVTQQIGAEMAHVGIVTLPIWLRVRLSTFDVYELSAYFDYSQDGINWTNLWSQKGYGAVKLGHASGRGIGLMVGNGTYSVGSPWYSIEAHFAEFKMIPSTPFP